MKTEMDTDNEIELRAPNEEQVKHEQKENLSSLLLNETEPKSVLSKSLIEALLKAESFDQTTTSNPTVDEEQKSLPKSAKISPNSRNQSLDTITSGTNSN